MNMGCLSIHLLSFLLGFPGGLVSLPMQEMREMQVQSLGREDPLEEDMATHPSILAWKILWTEEPGVLQSMGLKRIGHNWTRTQGI